MKTFPRIFENSPVTIMDNNADEGRKDLPQKTVIRRPTLQQGKSLRGMNKVVQSMIHLALTETKEENNLHSIVDQTHLGSLL